MPGQPRVHRKREQLRFEGLKRIAGLVAQKQAAQAEPSALAALESEDEEQASLLEGWSKSTAAFAYGSGVKTIDEKDELNPEKPVPFREDVLYWFDALDSGDDTVVIKSRQVYCTLGALIAGMKLCAFRPRTKIAWKGQTDAEGLDHIENRLKPAWETLPDWFKARYTFKKKRGAFAIETCNGVPWESFIVSIPKGSNTLRSKTWTRIVLDEFMFHEDLKQVHMGCAATIQGQYDEHGVWRKGQLVLTSTPNLNQYGKDLLGADHELLAQVAMGLMNPADLWDEAA